MRASFVQFRQLKNFTVKIIAGVGLFFWTFQLSAQSPGFGRVDSAKIPLPQPHFLQEYAFDSPVDAGKWQKESRGLHVSFASTDQAWFRTEVPVMTNPTLHWDGNGWKGERLNRMILTWSTDTVSQVRFKLNDLKDDKGHVISKNNIQLQLVRYVISNYPYDAGDVSCGEGPADKAYLLPDRLEAFERFDLPGKTVRPVWLSVNIPAGTIAGHYKGSIEIISEQQQSGLDLDIRVQDQTLPLPHNWSFRLDLWQNPWVIAEYYKVKPWSNEHKALLKQHLRLYAEAGGKYITTYAVHSPWADASYMTEGTMIEWTRDRDGKWNFDYSIFDQYVQLAMEAGIDKAITIYTPIPWGERFRYIDGVTGNYVTEQWEPTSDVFRTNWNSFLTGLKSHLEKKGWFNKTYLGINENAMEQTLSAIKVIKAHSTAWKITYAGDWHPELDGLLDDYSCVYGKEPGMEDIRKRSSRGQTSTYYICCTPPKPNTFVFSPPVEGRWLGWYAMAHGYNGLLRWAYDAWVADPARDARHIYWPAGDAFMVYPGANSSIRFEKMREGIIDFEKLKILKAQAARSGDPRIRGLTGELDQLLRSFNDEHDFIKEKLEMDLQKGKTMITELSDLLAGTKNK